MAKNLFETGEKPEDVDDTNLAEEGDLKRESPSASELLELPDEELKQYGIDDPKQWKSYQRLLHKKENQWSQEKELLESKLNDYDSKLSELEKKFTVKEEPKEVLKAPVLSPRPSGFNMAEAITDPESNSAKWYNEYQQYLIDKANYQDNVINSLTNTIQEERQIKQQNQAREVFKSKTIAEFQQNGLEPKDAVEAYNALETIYASDIKNGTKLFAELYKNRGKISQKEADFDKRKAKKDDFLPPGLESSGAVPSDSFESSFIKEIQGSNKTKQIIGQRVKKR